MKSVNETLRAILQSIWDSLVGLPLAEGKPGMTLGKSWQARVAITGHFRGMVLVSASPALATKLAVSMLAETGLDDSEIRDAFGEIANMVAGNMRAMFPQPNEISLPTVDVVEAPAPEPGELVADVCVLCEEQLLSVRIFRTD